MIFDSLVVENEKLISRRSFIDFFYVYNLKFFETVFRNTRSQSLRR